MRVVNLGGEGQEPHSHVFVPLILTHVVKVYYIVQLQLSSLLISIYRYMNYKATERHGIYYLFTCCVYPYEVH